jgi:hypothetical protein
MGGVAAAMPLGERLPELSILFTSGYAEGKDADACELSIRQKPHSPTVLDRASGKIPDPPSPATRRFSAIFLDTPRTIQAILWRSGRCLERTFEHGRIL